MSMTLEEAIKNREDCLKYLDGCGPKASPDCLEAARWSVKALKALRPVSREQVERVRGKWIEDKYSFSHCSLCGYEQEEPELITPFCANCGAPMTDEAVDMMMERLEELYHG